MIQCIGMIIWITWSAILERHSPTHWMVNCVKPNKFDHNDIIGDVTLNVAIHQVDGHPQK